MNVAGMAYLGGGFTLDTFDGYDEKGATVGGGAGFQLPVETLSVCPGVAVSYSTIDLGPFKLSAVAVPIGFGVGRRV